MKEDQLQKQVLVPLFVAMGFQDVTIYQGASELGKDIVMWKPGDLGERVNYAVVAKARKISGKAAGTSSAAEVRFQIEQAFGNPWPDTKTTEMRRVERCFVVCSKQIQNEAITAIRAVLENSNLEKVTRFINGDELWHLIQQHLPEKVVFENLQAIQNVLDQASPHYRLVAKTTGEMIIEPKDPQTLDQTPLVGRFKVSFPDNVEGRKAREEFERHLAAGTPVTIRKPYLEEFVLPDVLAKFIDLPNEKMQLTLGPAKLPKPLLAKISITADTGEQSAMEYIQFEGIAGREELSLQNDAQPVPWKFKLVINMKNNAGTVSYHIEPSNLNVREALDSYRFMSALSLGGTLKVEHIQTGFILASMTIPSAHFPSPDQLWMEILEALVLIQQKTSTLIGLPKEEPLTRELINTIFSTAEKLKTGKALFAGEDLKSVVGRETAQNILAQFGEGQTQSIASQHKDDQIVTIFGVDIALGPVTFFCEKVFMTAEDVAQLRESLTQNSDGATFPIRLTIAKGHPVHVYYPKWLSPEEVKELTEDNYP